MKLVNFLTPGLAAMQVVDAMDWGDMSQYKTRLEKLPTLSGDTIWLSGQEDEGFDIVLSKDTQAKAEGVLEACGTADDKCFQDVSRSLRSAILDLDNTIQRRIIGSMLSKTTKGSWNIIANIALMLELNWKMKGDKMDASAFYLPHVKAEQAAQLAAASSAVHTAGPSVVITVTPTPAPMTLTGSAAPALTTAPSDTDGHKKGDILATLDTDLARKINEVVQRIEDCEDGRQFDAKHGTRKRAGTATYGQALCAAEGVVGMSGKGDRFADLTMLSHDNIGIEFAVTAGKAKEALLVLKDFIIAYSPVLAIPPELVEQFGTYVLAIIIDSLVINDTPVGPMNFIGPDLAVMQLAHSPIDPGKNKLLSRQARVTCRNHPLSAPISEKDANGGTGVEKVVENWCNDHDGKVVGSDGLYFRGKISRLGVGDRSSFWLRAAKTCDKQEKFNKEQCKKALKEGMRQCDKGPETHGLAASIGCLDYSIDLSGVTDDKMPPWDEKKSDRKFPPPEFAARRGGKGQGYAPICDAGRGEDPLTDGDLNTAIDAFCQNGQQIKGFGNNWANMFNYPPENKPQFYNHRTYKMHLTFGAETVNKPYEDINWCKGYDWKMGKDDCTYALRKLYHTCSGDRSKKLKGGEYTYRCIRYKSWPVNTR